MEEVTRDGRLVLQVGKERVMNSDRGSLSHSFGYLEAHTTMTKVVRSLIRQERGGPTREGT